MLDEKAPVPPWGVIVRVFDPEGRPVPDARVQSPDDLVDDGPTDEDGYLIVSYDEHRFDDLSPGKSLDLCVEAKDREGNSSGRGRREGVRPERGQTEYLEIVLEGGSPPPPTSDEAPDEPSPEAWWAHLQGSERLAAGFRDLRSRLSRSRRDGRHDQ